MKKQNNESVTCKHCSATAVVKFGTYKGIQLYWCKVCNRKYKADSALFHSKVPAEYIDIALVLYFSGKRVGYIRDYLRQYYGYYPSESVVYGWINRYTDIVKKVLKDYKPKVGDIWIVDETPIKISGQKVWLFDIVDSKTRYLLSTRVALKRTSHGTRLLMDEAVKNADKNPKKLITYKAPVELESTFGTKSEYKRNQSFIREPNPYKIERLQRPFIGQNKARLFKSINSAIKSNEGFMLYYNYFLPNDALGGRTPAEAAKVDYPYKTWTDVIRRLLVRQIR